MEFYQHEQMTEHLIRITDITYTYMYLVLGRERALLIDTGTGYGNLKTYVKALTELPITVCLTHGHVDHAGGAGWFDEVYLNHKDVSVVPEHGTPKMKMDYLAMTNPACCDKLQPEDHPPVYKNEFLPMEDGHTFDLGGLTVQMLAFPGHTQGSMCPLICEDRIIIYGDACNPFVFLFEKYCSSVEGYMHTMTAMKEKEHLFDRVFLSHGNPEVDKAILDGDIQVCKDILEGNTDNIPFDFMGDKFPIAKAMDAAMQRIDGKLGNIVYNPNRVR